MNYAWSVLRKFGFPPRIIGSLSAPLPAAAWDAEELGHYCRVYVRRSNLRKRRRLRAERR